MNEKHDSFEGLARKVAHGDERAREALRGALDPHLARIVRRALERGDTSSSLVRRIASAARDFAGDPDACRLAADRIGATIVNRLRPGTEDLGVPATVLV